jgi:predicted restriction endonuclease
MRRSPMRRSARLGRRTRLRRRTPLTRAAVAPASPAQRAKVAGQRCIVCGAATRIDPAHLVPRAIGGCDEADCVVALCRTHHRAYDQAGLDLVAFLEPDYRREVAHAVLHLGLTGSLRRLGGRDTLTAEG